MYKRQLLMRAVEAATDALFREEDRDATTPTLVNERHTELEERTPEQRRADAMGLIAERALAAGFGEAEKDSRSPAPISGSRAERYQVMLHVEEATLREFTEPGQSELEDGTRVSAETSKRISCDCGVVAIGHGPDGQVMSAGRRSRTVPPALRRALEARDRGCRFPGCGLRFTEAHHIVHWADGGETSLRNTVLLCRTHHRAVHEGRVQVCMDVGGQVAFFTPKGKVLFDAPKTRFLDRLEPVLGSVEGPKLKSAEKPELKPVPGSKTEWESELEPGSGPGMEPTKEGEPGSDRKGYWDPKPFPRHAPLPAHLSGAAKWTRDRDIPFDIEARAWEALDSEWDRSRKPEKLDIREAAEKFS